MIKTKKSKIAATKRTSSNKTKQTSKKPTNLKSIQRRRKFLKFLPAVSAVALFAGVGAIVLTLSSANEITVIDANNWRTTDSCTSGEYRMTSSVTWGPLLDGKRVVSDIKIEQGIKGTTKSTKMVDYTVWTEYRDSGSWVTYKKYGPLTVTAPIQWNPANVPSLKFGDTRVRINAGVDGDGAPGCEIIHVSLQPTASVTEPAPAPSPTPTPTAPAPAATTTSSNAGAKLPISYDINGIVATKRFVSPSGNDSTGNGSLSSPYATLGKAISVATSNDTIVLRGGIYREGNVNVPSTKALRIVAYPGEIPEFRGSKNYTTGWTTEGSYKYRSYTPQPVTDGSGISFTTGQNLTSSQVGKHPDQAWVGDTQLRQVTSKSAVTAGNFWVDSANNRIYLHGTNVTGATIEVSDKDVWITVSSPNTTLEGIKVTRYSNSANDYGVIRVQNTADNNLLKNMYISDASFIAVNYAGNSDLNKNSTMQNTTIQTSNWMGVSATYTDYLKLDGVHISRLNQFDEFTSSPQSGALKTSRTRYTKVLNSVITNNRSHGLWFDQSNYDVDVANNRITDNTGTGVFFEISDDLLLINNYIKATGEGRPTRLAGSSGLKIINNTIVGGADSLGVFTDTRSIAGCAVDASKCQGASTYSSDRDTVRPKIATMDWMPRIDAMYNNIIAYSTNAGWCGNTTTCISVSSENASAPIQTIIHKADSGRGIPQTFINGNVYANGSNRIITASNKAYYNLSGFTSAMAASPVYISGIDINSKLGNSWVNADGSPTSALAAKHGEAIAIPTNADINTYIAAGTKYYGAR